MENKKKLLVSLEREFSRCDFNGKETEEKYLKVFGNESKNIFIKRGLNGNNLRICATFDSSISKLYNKFEEIMNVIYTELYKQNEYVVASKFLGRYSYVTISLIREETGFNKSIIENFNKNVSLLCNIYGNPSIELNDNMVVVKNIRANYLNKNGFTENDLRFWISFILLSENEVVLKEILSERLKEISNINHLKAVEAIEKIEKEIATRLVDESKLTESEILNLSKKHSEEGYNSRYGLQKYTKLVAESVVLLKDAIALGVDYEVLNEAKSVVLFKGNNHEEFVIEGNKTNRDSYIFPIITDDKLIAKQIMAKAGLSVPNAILLEKEMDEEEIESIVSPFFNSKLVVKPRNTNYGIGITVFSDNASKEQIMKAINYAFKFDDNVLIEEYAKGMEYRFLVVDGKCLSVVNRRPASVIGDGKSTISELIDRKNEEPWHYLLANMFKKDEPVVEYLKLQNLTLDSVIPEGKRIFVRSNSNCSTGGESVDYTSVMPDKFKRVSEKAANAFNGKICGVDIIIDDINEDKYSIIEINDNPGYSISEWTYEGSTSEVRIGNSVLKLLNLI